MSEHFTRNTEEVTRWCNHCGRFTQHIVSDGRLGRCKEHDVGNPETGLSKAQEKARADREREAASPRLFPDRLTADEIVERAEARRKKSGRI
jgi:hypothetical protein